MIIPFKVGVVTASDRSSAGTRPDKSGQLLISLIHEQLTAEVIAYRVVPDDKEFLKKTMLHMSNIFFCDMIFTTGGTGLASRDVTPEATKEIIERELPGIAEAIRYESKKKTKFAMLSRGIAGVHGKTLIINLPGSPEAVKDGFNAVKDILPHAAELIRGEVVDCRLQHLHSSHS